MEKQAPNVACHTAPTLSLVDSTQFLVAHFPIWFGH